MEYTNHLYMMLYPSNFLISSQLSPEQLGKHYLTGSKQNYNGRLIFAEIDNNYRNDFLDIEWGLEQLIPHKDGSPKATKFISSYRVLEHIEFKYIKKLYLSSASGYVMGIDSKPFVNPENGSKYKIFACLPPLSMMSVSTLNFEAFGQHIVTDNKHKGAPKVFYTQLEFDSKEFKHEFDNNPLMPTPVPGIHPGVLNYKIDAIKRNPKKATKGLKLNTNLQEFPPQLFRHGFMFVSSSYNLYFPMPDRKEIEEKHYQYYRTM